MSSPSRYVFSTSRFAFAGLLVSLAAVTYVVLERLPLWKGDWWWGVNNLAQALPVLMLIVALVVGWQAGSVNSGIAALVERGPDSVVKVLSGIAVVPYLAVAIPYLLGVAAVVAVTLKNEGVIGPDSLVVIGSQLAMLAFATALGLGSGAILRAPYSALLAASLTGLALFLSPPLADSIFLLAGPVQSVVGYGPSLSHAFVLLGACLVATVSLCWLAASRVKPKPKVIAAFSIASAAIVAGAYLVPADAFGRNLADATRCVDQPVEVCVYPGYDQLLRPAAHQLDQLRGKSVVQGLPADALPSRFVQYAGDLTEVGVGTLQISDDARRSNQLSPTDLALSLSDPLWCPAMFTEPTPVELLQRRDLVFNWLLWIQGEIDDEELITRHEVLASVPQSQRVEIVEEQLGRLKNCEN